LFLLRSLFSSHDTGSRARANSRVTFTKRSAGTPLAMKAPLLLTTPAADVESLPVNAVFDGSLLTLIRRPDGGGGAAAVTDLLWFEDLAALASVDKRHRAALGPIAAAVAKGAHLERLLYGAWAIGDEGLRCPLRIVSATYFVLYVAAYWVIRGCIEGTALPPFTDLCGVLVLGLGGVGSTCLCEWVCVVIRAAVLTALSTRLLAAVRRRPAVRAMWSDEAAAVAVLGAYCDRVTQQLLGEPPGGRPVATEPYRLWAKALTVGPGRWAVSAAGLCCLRRAATLVF